MSLGGSGHSTLQWPIAFVDDSPAYPHHLVPDWPRDLALGSATSRLAVIQDAADGVGGVSAAAAVNAGWLSSSSSGLPARLPNHPDATGVRERRTDLSERLAVCQGVPIAALHSCEAAVAHRGGSASAAAADTAALASIFEVAAEAAVAAGKQGERVPLAAMTAHRDMRMVGVLQPGSFQPVMPVVTKDMAAPVRVAGRGSAMMVDTAAGHLYAAPPSLAAATVHTSAFSLQPPSEGLQPGGRAPGAVPDAALQEQELLASMLWGSDEPGALQRAPSSASRGRQASLRVSTGRRMAAAAAAALAGGRRRLQGLFGEDTRKEVRGLPQYPLSATGHLLFSNPIDVSRYQCSGTLIGTWTVLTAAHCVVARSGQVQNNITFTAGQTLANATGLGTAKGVRVIFNSEYLSSAKAWVGWDLGVIVLDRPLGVASTGDYVQELRRLKQQAALQAKRLDSSSSQVISRSLQPTAGITKPQLSAAVQQPWAPGSLGYAAAPALHDTLLVSTGYPGDKPLGSAWTMRCRLTDTGDGAVVPNTCPIVNGQSGAGLIERRAQPALKPGTDKASAQQQPRHSYYVRAIASFEMCERVCDGGVCCPGAATHNGALKLTPEFVEFIDAHRHATPLGNAALAGEA